MADKITTDELGFPLTVTITVGDFENYGRHRTYAGEDGETVIRDEEHFIEIKYGLSNDELVNVAAHEAYHLFYSIRHLITCDEETQAEAFGHLVRRIVKEATI